MYVISVKRFKDSHTIVISPEWEYLQYDTSINHFCFGGSLRLAKVYVTVEEAEKDFRSILDDCCLLYSITDEMYDLSTLCIWKVRTVFQTEKALTTLLCAKKDKVFLDKLQDRLINDTVGLKVYMSEADKEFALEKHHKGWDMLTIMDFLIYHTHFESDDC